MSLKFANRVRETTTTNGTGSVTLIGPYAINFQSFSSGIGDGNKTYYAIVGQKTSDWEVGIGTYTASSNSLSRDTVLESSNSGSLVDFIDGIKDVFCTPPSQYTEMVAAPATLASASTVNLGSLTTALITVTGNTTITSLGTADPGVIRRVKFDNTLTLTYNATSLILPGAANMTTAANDSAVFISLGSGDWFCMAYNRANGKTAVPLTSTDITTALGYTPAHSGANSDITSLSGITGGISLANYVAFNTAYTTPLTAGQIGWDGNNTLGLGMIGGNVIQRIGEDQYYYIKASSAITKGQVIMFTGAVGASGVVTGAPATGVTDGSYIMGVAAESIALNAFGLIQFQGTLKGLDTLAFTDGAILWYDPSVTGGLTMTKPSAPNVKVQIAAVIHAGNGGSGSILIRVSAGSILGGTDSNVEFGTLSGGNIIQYDGALGYWKNIAPSDLTGVGSLANSLTIGTGLSGTSYNGSSAVTIAIDSTVATLTGGQTLTNKTISGANNTLTNIGNSSLTNSSVTFNGSTVSLGGSATITANTTNSATFNSSGTGDASGTTFNGSAAKTISYNTVGASPLAGSSSLTTVGTITSGTWNGGTIDVGHGGTGVTTLSGLAYGNGSAAFTAATAAEIVSAIGSTAVQLATTVTTNANLTGEATSVGNAVTLTNSAVIGKVLTGYVSNPGTVSATDSILQAIQKLAGNVSLVSGAIVFKGLWDASTNTPTLASGVGTTGYMYRVSVAGSTNLDGLTDWNVGDSLYFDGTVWAKQDGNPTEVLSVAGRTGIVTLSSSDISGLAASATTDTTNASNISSGTLSSGRLPAFTGGDVTSSSGSAVLTLNTITQAATGSFVKVTIDSKGRVTGNTAVVESDITGLLGTGSITSTMLADTTVVAGPYTNANITVDADGRITAASNGSAGATITDDTSTNTTVYPLLAASTSGDLSTVNTSSTKLTYNPSTGDLGAINFNSLSDANKKKDVETIQNAIEILMSLRGVFFKWKDNDIRSLGVIAQEVEPYLPEAVVTLEDGVKTVSYGNIVGLLIEAFKSHESRISRLEQALALFVK